MSTRRVADRERTIDDADSRQALSDAGRLSAYDILRLLAPNPGSLTLSGTNTWVVGRRPTWVVDPGPALEAHLQQLFAAVEQRGGLGVWWGAPRPGFRGYFGHRLDRERRLLAALAEGRRTASELLDAAWSDVPAQLRPVAAITLAAHIDKLEEERLLPAGVERPGL